MTNDIRKSVLLVESEDSLARAMDHVVTQDGHRCARLSTGDTIAKRVAEDRPDLLMLDMSHTNRAAAMDACQTIRRSPDLGKVKILMLQSNGNGLERRRGLAMGANGMVTLPFRLDELRAEMRRLLGDDLDTTEIGELGTAPTGDLTGSRVMAAGDDRVH